MKNDQNRHLLARRGTSVIMDDGRSVATLVEAGIYKHKDGWHFDAVLRLSGPVAELEGWGQSEHVWEEWVLSSTEKLGVAIQPEGGEGPGRPFASIPWVRWCGGGLVIVSQHGGLDV